VAFNSPAGKKLFAQSLEHGFLDGSYWSLSENFNTQNDPASCGLGTLAMMLNSLHLDPQRVWKGPWRWFTEAMLLCCKDYSDLSTKGITLSEFASLARCQDAHVEQHVANTVSKEEFRRDVMRVCGGRQQKVESEAGWEEVFVDANTRMTVAFSRAHLGQTGSGHFSPVAAYNEVEDMVLIMDVARFKYPSYWVSLSSLYDAMHPIDPESGTPRGYMLVSPPQRATAAHVTATRTFMCEHGGSTIHHHHSHQAQAVLDYGCSSQCSSQCHHHSRGGSDGESPSGTGSMSEWFHICYSNVVKHFLNDNVTRASAAALGAGRQGGALEMEIAAAHDTEHHRILHLTELVDFLFPIENPSKLTTGVSGRVRVKGSWDTVSEVTKELRETLVCKLVSKSVSQAPEIATLLLLASANETSYLHSMLNGVPHLQQALTSGAPPPPSLYRLLDFASVPRIMASCEIRPFHRNQTIPRSPSFESHVFKLPLCACALFCF
jgi:glutathione gamma-glutamylcysteinyltransferase